MSQNVTLKIGGKEYHLSAPTPEVEQYMRLAAENINTRLDSFGARYSNVSDYEKLMFVAVQEAVRKIDARRKLQTLKAECDALDQQLGDYLDGIDK